MGYLAEMSIGGLSIFLLVLIAIAMILAGVKDKGE